MAHFAKIGLNSRVIETVVVHNNELLDGIPKDTLTILENRLTDSIPFRKEA